MDGLGARAASVPHDQQQQQQLQQQLLLQQHQQATIVGAGVASVGPTAGQRNRVKKAWYLDAPENDASPSLLAELGIVFHEVNLENANADVNIQLWKLAQSRLTLNSKSGGDVLDRGAIQIGDLPATAFTHDDMEDQGGEARFDSLEGMYYVWGGEAFVDVRDWADCWVRVRLQPGDVVLIPPNRFHRATPKSPGARLVQVRVKTGDGGVNVDIRDPRTAPAPGSSGSLAGDPRELVTNLCRQFYHLGWVTGTGGSISIRHGNRIFMTPSGVQKEQLRATDLFVLDRQGTVLSHPFAHGGASRLKISACAPLFQHAYSLRSAGAVIHSHGIYCVMAALICERNGEKTFRITHQEMIKGMQGHGYHDELVIPIIDNTAKEEDLADALADAITRYPKSNAVLVQRHGCYVWGSSWESAKTQSECLHYLLEAAVKMEGAGLNPRGFPHGGCLECGAGTSASRVASSSTKLGGSNSNGAYTSSSGEHVGGAKNGGENATAAASAVGNPLLKGAPTAGGKAPAGLGGGGGATTGSYGAYPNTARQKSPQAPTPLQEASGAGIPVSDGSPRKSSSSTSALPDESAPSGSGSGSGSVSGSGSDLPHGARAAGEMGESGEKRWGEGDAKKRRLWTPGEEPDGKCNNNGDDVSGDASAGVSSGGGVGDGGGGGGVASGGGASDMAGSSATSSSSSSSSSSPKVSLEGVKVVLLDIEGTTTPITFVHDKLFPYAREHLAKHLAEKWTDEDLQKLVLQLKAQSEIDATAGMVGVPQVLEASGVGVERAQASVAEYVRFLMASDRKLGPMKSLQGQIWRQGYADGGLTGEVYADVEPAFKRWTAGGRRLAIYSSGSREAQRLLFSHSTAGDLRPYISAYFDTSVGGKSESSSYREICLSLGVDDPSDILFVTDLHAEAEAAKSANLRVLLSVRPGNAPLPEGQVFTSVSDMSVVG